MLGTWAYLSSILAFVLLSVFTFFNIAIGLPDFISVESLRLVVYNVQIAVCLLIVAVPEGLPLAISMALAFSTERLKNDNLLIRNLEALETSGSLLDICVGKTGILTEGKLSVQKLFVG